jgi:hypothetical protein
MSHPPGSRRPQARAVRTDQGSRGRHDGRFVEQNALDALEIADRGYLLVDGSNAREGRAGELAADSEVRHAFLGG